jgi:hypothetical protein
MRNILIISFLLLQIINAFSQDLSKETNFKQLLFDCRGDSVYIELPSDFIGPKYDGGEEGPIVFFYAKDLSFVSVLCAGNTILQLDSNYIKVDSIKTEKTYNVLYFNKEKNLYGRMLQTKKHFYMYSDATLKRKQDLDKTFKILEGKDNN